MSYQDVITADNVTVSASDEQDIPDGWSKTHEEYSRPVDDVGGYYIHTYESEHFLVSHKSEDRKNGMRVHSAVLLKVKRGEDGERLTAIGTGIYQDVVRSEETPEYTEDSDGNIEANKDAEKAAFQLAVNIMKEVNNGKYEDKKYSESDRYS